MSTPQPQPPKGARRSSRRSKNISAGIIEPDHNVSDSGPSPSKPHHIAAGQANAPTQPQTERDSQRRKSQGPKKTNNTPKPERAPHHQHAPSQPNLTYSSQRQGTPIKQQAYAGPTFHSSPAPSALPIPSFYSKSIPAVPSIRTPDIVEETEAQEEPEMTTEDNTTTEKDASKERESTPLDFLFEAARHARATPQAESPASRSANLSIHGDSPVNRSPAPREGRTESVFPFELEGNASHTNAIGPAFATPYKERLNAMRSASASPGATTPVLDEEERRAKSEALKKLLMNNQSQPPRPKSASNPAIDMSNPFNARVPEMRNATQSPYQPRHHSGPSTPVPFSHAPIAPQYFPPMPTNPYDPRVNGSPMHRPASSHLRRQYHVQDEDTPIELSSDSTDQATPISTARRSARQAQPTYQSPYKSDDQSSPAMPRTGQVANHRQTHSTQQLEDDLRRVLKLDLTSRG